MPAASSITPITCASPSGRGPKPCATSGIPHAELVAQFDLMFVVHRIKMDYLRPARLDETVIVVTEPMLRRRRVGDAASGVPQAAEARKPGDWPCWSCGWPASGRRRRAGADTRALARGPGSDARARGGHERRA